MRTSLALLPLLLSAPASAAAPEPPAAVLTVCDDVQDPLTLDPQKEFSEKNHTIVQQMFEGLVRFGPDGVIEPALATEWRQLDPKTIQFKLREGVSFHNGEPFNAESVKFSVERYLNPATAFPALGFIDSVERVQIVAENTVNVITKYPDGLLLNRLAGFMVMVPPKYYGTQSEDALRENPVGSGPFVFRRWVKGERIVLGANRAYWERGSPKSDELVFRFLPLDKQVDALLSGELDILTNLPGTRTLDVQASSRTIVVKKPTFYTVAGNFNVARKPLSNKRIREALNLGIDRKALVRYDILGNGLPIGTLTLPGEFGHNADLEPYPYDPVKARRILQEEGYPKGFRLKVLMKINAVRTGQILAKQLERVGIVFDSTPVADSQLYDRLKHRDQWDIAIYDCPDPMHHAFFIRSIFLARNSPFSLTPIAGVDERLEKLVKTLDVDEQREVSEELDAYIHSEFLALPTYQRIRTYGLRRGVTFTPYVSGMPYFFGASAHAPQND
ncbi:MAG: ABC transporter substrate-binding protein [Elusimicrobia bacterium]|nr:ABC transporter substrate-binding protein [Elusimicrobiota bacterium]